VTGRLSDVLLSDPRNGWSVRCDNDEAGTPVLTLSAVTGFRYRETEFKRTIAPTSPDAHYWLHDGDLLITRSNTPDLVGHAAIYSGKPAPCIYPDLVMKLVVDETAADKHFVHWWLRGTTARDYIRVNAKGTSPTMKKVSQGIVKAIPFPSGLGLAKERSVVERLDALQAKVDELKRLQAETQAELDALMPSILDRAFKGEL
jgi:type I restriction enzyme S subunit